MANTIVQQITAELEILQKELNQFKSTVAYLNDAKIQLSEAKDTLNSTNQYFAKRTTELKLAFDEVVSFKKKLDDLVLKIDSVDFPERLNRIENSFNELLVLEDSLSKELSDSINSLNIHINKIDFNKKHEELRKDVARLEKNNEQLIADIKSIDIPKRIETFKYSINTKLENTVAELEKNTRKISEETAKSIIDLNIPVRLDKVDANVAGIMAAVQAIQSRLDNLENNLLDKLKDIQSTSIQNKSDLSKTIDIGFSSLSKRHRTFSIITWGMVVLVGLAILAAIKYLNI